MHLDQREAIVTAGKDLVRLGLNHGTAGNISVRAGDAMLITPSGIAPDDTTAAMIASMPLASSPLASSPPASSPLASSEASWSGPLKPSSEWRLHRDILNHRPDVGAVVHTHSPYATVLATQHREIPALHYMIAAFGDSRVRCTPYAPFGTQELSTLIIDYLGSRHGVLLGNHGMVAVGGDLAQAMWRASELESLAKMFLLASASGTPVLLSHDEISRTVERFSDYGMAARRH